MAMITMIQRLSMFVIFASIIVAIPVNVVYKTFLPSRIESVKPTVDLSNGINIGATVHAFDPAILQSAPDEAKPVLVKDGTVRVDMTQTGRHNEVLSSLNEIDAFTFADHSHETDYEDNIESDAQILGYLHTADKSVEDPFTSQDISHRDTTEAMGYHNYAMVCAQSKVHTDYCANRRRGYYCSQNGFLQIHAVSASISLKPRTNSMDVGR